MDVRGLLDEGFAPRGGFLEPVRATQLADLVMSRADALASGLSGWIWWRSEDATVVETWLLSSRAYGVLMGAFEAQPDHADAGGWAAACDVLETLGGADAIVLRR